MGMPRRSRIAMFVLFALGCPALVAAKTWTFSWDSRPVEIHEGADGYAEITIEGGIAPTEVGVPNLPWVHQSIDLAPGQVVTSWRFVPDAPRPLHEGLRPRPVQIEANSANPEPSFVEMDSKFLESGYPSEPAIFQGMRATRGNMTAGFLFAPFRWDGQRLEFVSGGTLEIEVGPAPAGEYLSPPLRQPSELLRTANSHRAEPGAGSVLEAYSGDLGVSALPSLEGSAVHCVIVTTQALAPSFTWLVDWKNRNGQTTVIRTVEEIYAAYPLGVDQAEKIRLFLRDAYLYWGTEAAVIGGDPSLVPIRIAVSYSYGGAGTEITTDYYYSCLDGNWNANGNAVFGEPAGLNRIGDRADLNPELRVGRISARSAAEVAIYRTKYETYVMNPPDDPYFEEVLTLGEVLFQPNWQLGDCEDCQICSSPCVSSDGAEDCFDLIEEMSANPVTGENWNFNELYERDYWWKTRGHPNAQALNLTSAVSSLNAGQNIVFHAGHGDRDRWAIGPDRMEARNLHALTNGPRWGGLVYAVNCNSAAVAFDCAAEGWCFSPTGGGLVYVGSTNLDFPQTASIFRRQTFELWPGDGFASMGQAISATADSIATQRVEEDADSGYRFLLYSLIYLGDPDMHVWWTTPRELVVAYPAQITLGSEAATEVAVTLAGASLAGARVTLYKDGDALAVGETSASGEVSLPFLPTGTGQFLITVTHPEGKPFQGTGTVTAPASASFLSISGFEVDDLTNEGAGIVGNGNGLIEIGETVSLDLSLANRGTAEATNAVASLVVAEDGGLDVTVLDGDATLGSIGAGGTATANRAFQIRVEEGEDVDPSRVLETLHLEVTLGPAGAQHTETLEPNAYRTTLVLFTSTVIEVGDGDGIPDSGETWKIAFEFMNERESLASGLQVRLAPAPGNGIVINPPELLLPDADQFEVVASDTFEVSFFAPNQTDLEVFLEDPRTDPPTELWKVAFDLSVPNTPTGLTARGLRTNIALTWNRPADSDLAGYRLYRSSAADGPYARLGGTIPVASDAALQGYYSDEGLPPLTAYFYRIAAVDSSGHVSALSDSFPMSTSPGFLTGWPITLEAFSGSAPVVEDLNGFGDFEVIAASDVVYAFNSDGTDYYDGDDNTTTSGKLTDPQEGDDFRGKPAVADVDGDGVVEVIAVPNFRRRANGEPRNADLVVFDNLGNVKWRKPMASTVQISSPAVGNLDDTGSEPEIVVLASRAVFAFHGDGTPVGTSSNGRLVDLPDNDAYFLYGSVALADVAGGPGAEIIFTTRAQDSQRNTALHVLNADGTSVPGFPYLYAESGSSNDGSNSSPAVANIVTDDPQGEVVIATKNRIYLIDPTNASDVWWRDVGFFYDNDRPNPSPALGDINRDGQLEVVIGGDRGQLFVLDALTGEPLPQFDQGSGFLQISGNSAKVGSAIIGDLTGDQYPEILIGDSTGRVFCYQRNGVQLAGFPYVVGGDLTAGLAMWDIDKDHHVNVVIQSNLTQNVVVLDFPASVFNHGNPDLDRYPWTQFRHDSRNSGWMQTSPLLPLALQAPELTATRDLEVEVHWYGQAGFSKFHLYRRLASFEDFTLVGDWSPPEVMHGSESEFLAVDRVPESGTYVYRLVGVEAGGFEVITADREITVSTGTLAFALHAPHPNPFDIDSTIRLDLPRTGPVSVRILDPSGRRVRTLMEGTASAGSYTRTWDGKDENGRECGGGVYFVSVIANGVGEKSAKLIRLR